MARTSRTLPVQVKDPSSLLTCRALTRVPFPPRPVGEDVGADGAAAWAKKYPASAHAR